MYRNLKFLHMTDFFSTDTVRVSVTNIRYVFSLVSLNSKRLGEKVKTDKIIWLSLYGGMQQMKFCVGYIHDEPDAGRGFLGRYITRVVEYAD